MTAEEAIDYNKNLRMYMRLSDKNQPCKFLEENYIALDMAIKALEQEPCEDAVSRQTVLEYGCYNCGHVKLDKTCNVYCQLRAEGGRCEAYNSWTPLPEPSEDCISRQAAKKALEDRFIELQKRHSENRHETNYCLNTILELPPVIPERPKGEWKSDGHGHIYCTACNQTNVSMWKSDFCPICGSYNGQKEGSKNE